LGTTHCEQMKKSTFNLIQYSALSLSFLSLNESRGQAIYTDVDPDIILDSHGEIGTVDMDNDGVIDFAFLNTSGTLTSSSFIESYVEGIWVGPNSPQHGIIGYLLYISGYGGSTQYFPYAFLNDYLIGPSLLFHNWGFQRMAFRYFNEDHVLINYGGYWYTNILDHYLGIKFLDSEGDYHYGWIRCDVKDEGRTLVIKDYAYEDKPDVPIAAGDMIGNTIEFAYDKGDIHTGTDDNLFNQASIYSFGDRIYINVNDINEKSKVQIYNTAGELVYFGILTGRYSVLHLNQPAGVYFVQLISGNRSFGVNVFIS